MKKPASPRKRASAKETEPQKVKKVFVLDTSVILYDHSAVEHFGEHDVALPITVLEELDNFKKGNDIKNFEAREFIRFIDDLSNEHMLQDWIPLKGSHKGSFKVLMPQILEGVDAEKVFNDSKPDHKILNSALVLQQEMPDHKVVMVTKDINLRLKARALNLLAEDYETGKIQNVSNLYRGNDLLENIPAEAINKLYDQGYCPIEEAMEHPPLDNHYFILRNNKNSALAFYNPKDRVLERVDKLHAVGVKPRNAEQTFALHAILHPDIKLISIQGVAGTGKTLLALAGALEQHKTYNQIYLARPIVPLSNRDLGFLPGDVNSKIGPYMEPLWDNLKFIQNQFPEHSKENNRIKEMLEDDKLVITPLAYIRGRSLSNIIFIVDEAQNLTPHEIKTIITRAGENAKIIFTGDIHQIDTPYLDSQSNGLSFLIDKVKNHPLYAHITLSKGERSELANLANDLL